MDTSLKSNAFSAIQTEVDSLLSTADLTCPEILQSICQLLSAQIETYDWVGFYLVDPEAEKELILGPYVGESTDHTRIAFGQGICGQAAETLDTFIVNDVSKATNYLSCSLHVKSEIVVPVMKDGHFVAELDIDSRIINAMDEIDQKELEIICKKIERIF